MDNFSSNLENSALFNSPLNQDLSVAIDHFSATLQSIIDNRAPVIRRSVTLRHHAPWFTDEIRTAKAMRRRLERQWRADKTKANHQLYTDHCRVVNELIRNAKEVYYSSIIDNSHGNQQMFFQAINNLLYRKPLVRHPSTEF